MRRSVNFEKALTDVSREFTEVRDSLGLQTAQQWEDAEYDAFKKIKKQLKEKLVVDGGITLNMFNECSRVIESAWDYDVSLEVAFKYHWTTLHDARCRVVKERKALGDLSQGCPRGQVILDALERIQQDRQRDSDRDSYYYEEARKRIALGEICETADTHTVLHAFTKLLFGMFEPKELQRHLENDDLLSAEMLLDIRDQIRELLERF